MNSVVTTSFIEAVTNVVKSKVTCCLSPGGKSFSSSAMASVMPCATATALEPGSW